MSCQDCDEWQDSDKHAYYRWKNANIEVRACNKHLIEIFDALNKVQKEEHEKIAEKTIRRNRNNQKDD